MTDTSACGRKEFHILWCRDCASLIRSRFRDQVFDQLSTFGFGLRRSYVKTTKTQIIHHNVYLGKRLSVNTALIKLNRNICHFDMACMLTLKMRKASFVPCITLENTAPRSAFSNVTELIHCQRKKSALHAVYIIRDR